MTEQIGIRELRDNLTSTIRRVRGGVTLEITHHHQPVALLTPVRRDRLAALVQAGEVTPGTPLEEPLRAVPPEGSLTASEALEEDRAER
jgi:antitoxin (DNA-binding transcriptional repressor) of toxin-antitoxin stability system